MRLTKPASMAASLSVVLFASIILLDAASTTAYAQTSETISKNSVYISVRPHGGGVRTDDKTHLVYVGAGVDIYARTFDHAKGQYGPENLIRDNNSFGTNDYHNYPVMIQAPNGKLLVFYFKHSTSAFQLTSSKANSTAGTWKHKEILPAAEAPAYPTAVTAGNTVYLFYRHKTSGVYRPIRMVKSRDNGATWSKPKTVIDTGRAQLDKFNEIYLNDIDWEPKRSGHAERLRATFHLAGGEFHNAASRDVFMAYLHVDDDTWHTVAGNNMKDQIDKEDFANAVSSGLLVREVSPIAKIDQPVRARMPAQHVKSDRDRPVVVHEARNSAGNRIVASARWTGSKWAYTTILSSSSKDLDDPRGWSTFWGAGDMQFVDDATIGVLLYHPDGRFRFYQTSNSGASWKQQWEKDLSNHYKTGSANRFNTPRALGSKSAPLDFIMSAYHWATRKDDYSGKWETVILRH